MASSKYYYDRDDGGYPESLYDAVDARDLLVKFPKDVLDLGTVAGELSKEAAEKLGLKAGTPVAEGGVDAYVGAIGLGVVEPGKMALITGSSRHDRAECETHPLSRLLGRLHGRHDPWAVHRRGRTGLNGLHLGLVQEPVRRRRGRRGQRAWCRHLRRPDRTGEPRTHRFGRPDRARLLSGQSLALYRPPGARHDVGTDPEPYPWTCLPRHHRGHLLRYGEHPAHHARARFRAQAQRRLRWTGQERAVDADACRRVERADLVHQSERGPRPRLGDAGRHRGRYLPRHPGRGREHGPHCRHHRARPWAPRGVQILRGPLYGSISADEGAYAQDGALRRRQNTRGGGVSYMGEQRIEAALREATDTQNVNIGAGALTSVPDVFRESFGDSSAVVVADGNTFEVAGKEVRRRLERAGHTMIESYVFPAEPPLYAEYGNVEQLRGSLREHDAIPVAVGSGTINDIVKRSAHECERPYMCVATAASMDGYTAFGASIEKDGLKQTLSCPAPRAVVADLEVLEQAPKDMTASGYADLLGKVTSGADWLVADALEVEKIEPTGWSLVQDHLRGWTDSPAELRAGDQESTERLMEGLILSGLGMQSYQSSRTASGAEHQFSHLWEMEGLGHGEGHEGTSL